MRRFKRVGAGLVGAVAIAAAVQAPAASASVASFCDQIGGQWNGQYCHSSVTSNRKAVRQIDIAIPGEIEGAGGQAIRDYLTNLMNNWKIAGSSMVADSFGTADFETFQHGDIHTVVFHETYHADGPWFANAFRTFASNGAGDRVQLVDLLKPGTPLSAIPPLAGPYINDALDVAPPPHNPGTYPFLPERWTPDKVYSGGYQAWALTPTELILYLPNEPVGRDTPTDFTTGVMQWSMDGGTVQPRIPLSALSPILRPGLA